MAIKAVNPNTMPHNANPAQETQRENDLKVNNSTSKISDAAIESQQFDLDDVNVEPGAAGPHPMWGVKGVARIFQYKVDSFEVCKTPKPESTSS